MDHNQNSRSSYFSRRNRRNFSLEDLNIADFFRLDDIRWPFNEAGRYIPSPPGASSPNSMNSPRGYNASPEDQLDSMINTFMQACAHNLGASISGNIQIPQANVRCRDCTPEILCDACSMRVRMSPIDGDNNGAECILPHDIPQVLNPAIVNPNLRSLQRPFYCEIHHSEGGRFCQTCCIPFCIDCEFQLHHFHVIVEFKDAVEKVCGQAGQVLREARLGISTLRDELDEVQVAAEMLEQKARQATADLQMCMKRIAMALESRERELLAKIEKARAQKHAALQQRDDGIRSGIIRLSRAVDALSEVIEGGTYVNNPMRLTVIKDMAAAEISQIRQSYRSLPSHEENWISFNCSETHVISAIANFGNIIVNNPGSIGDRRALRYREHLPHVFLERRSISIEISPIRGKAVALSRSPVVVKVNRNPDVPMKPIKTIGNTGNIDDNLCRPWGVACDREGHMIVADRSNNRIQIYRHDGLFIRRFGSYGTGPGQFDRPAGVAVDARRRIIVADKDNHRIQILTMEGEFLLCFGEKGSRCGQFNYPWDVAANSECQIVVSDTRNHRVQLFSAEGIFLRKYGHEASPNMWKHFDSPRGVAFNPEGQVVTTDFNNHRVVIIDADFTNAKIFECKHTGGNKQFLRPQGLVIDDDGNVIVADSRNHRVQIFDPSGALIRRFGSYGKGDDEEMDRPSGISLCPDGKIAVVDFGNNRLLVI